MTFDIEFHKTHFAIDKINKVYIGNGGGGSGIDKPYREIKQRLIISITTFSETVMFEIKCILYLNHFYAEQICFRAMVTINTQ